MNDTDKSRPTFRGLGLSPEVIAVLEELGYEEPTPIQSQAIPLLLAGRDVLGSAATGTGKTAAFALPLIERLDPKVRAVQGLVLAPTRELAMQVAEAVHRYGHRRVTVLPIYGGQPIQRQLSGLKRGVQVVVGTPGRVLDHIRRGSLDLSGVRYLVLDEADEMLDMGFIEDIEAILEETPKERQTALFSATFPPRINELVKRHLRNPERVTIKAEVRKTPRVRQLAYVVPRAHKLEALGRILDLESPTSAIIFCRTRTEVDELTEAMASHGYNPEALHGGFAQAQRDRVMNRFREGVADLLIATDVAARGLDIEHVSHVINFDIPESPDVYVHRIGRTGRAGREGTAITLVQPREHRLLKAIESVVKQRIESARIPTVADLRARRIEMLTAALRETLIENTFDNYRVAVQSLAEEFDTLDIASAAAKLAAEATLGDEADKERDIPQFEEQAESRSFRHNRPAETPSRRDRQRGQPVYPQKKNRREAQGHGKPNHAVSPWGDSSAQQRSSGHHPPKRRNDAMTRLVVKVGDQRNVRPKDLVGAIANEADIAGDAIGAIQIGDESCLVEVPEAVADKVLRALSRTTIKGQRVTARRERER
ncbi:MAG: ATP-dependent helicase DeaD [Betaproteobacteria bacterium]